MGRKKLVGNLAGRVHSVYLSVDAELVLREIERERKLAGVFVVGWLNSYLSERLLADFAGKVRKTVLRRRLLDEQKLRDEAELRIAQLVEELRK